MSRLIKCNQKAFHSEYRNFIFVQGRLYLISTLVAILEKLRVEKISPRSGQHTREESGEDEVTSICAPAINTTERTPQFQIFTFDFEGI